MKKRTRTYKLIALPYKPRLHIRYICNNLKFPYNYLCQVRLKLAKRRSSIDVKLTGGRIEKWTTDGGLKLIKSLIEVFSLGELKTEGKCTKTKKVHTHRCTHIYSSAKIVSA